MVRKYIEVPLGCDSGFLIIIATSLVLECTKCENIEVVSVLVARWQLMQAKAVGPEKFTQARRGTDRNRRNDFFRRSLSPDALVNATYCDLRVSGGEKRER